MVPSTSRGMCFILVSSQAPSPSPVGLSMMYTGTQWVSLPDEHLLAVDTCRFSWTTSHTHLAGEACENLLILMTLEEHPTRRCRCSYTPVTNGKRTDLKVRFQFASQWKWSLRGCPSSWNKVHPSWTWGVGSVLPSMSLSKDVTSWFSQFKH